MRLLQEVLGEKVVTTEREMAFGPEGPFCSEVRGVHVVTKWTQPYDDGIIMPLNKHLRDQVCASKHL